MESGENGRTKLGSFLVFLVFLVAECVKMVADLSVYELSLELGLWDVIQQPSLSPQESP